MRVIAGKARSLQLKTPKGMETRPTTDRIKETLFNILNPYIVEGKFLDLFSGSGGIGIEALSRGAAYAYFVDNSRQAIEVIKENLQHTKLTEQGEVLSYDALSAIAYLESKGEPMDVIFMDPPYKRDFEVPVLQLLSKSALVDEYTLIVVESDLYTEFDYLEGTRLYVDRVKNYKTNKHTFIRCNKTE